MHDDRSERAALLSKNERCRTLPKISVGGGPRAGLMPQVDVDAVQLSTEEVVRRIIIHRSTIRNRQF